MHLYVASDDVHQKITRKLKLKLFSGLCSISINTVHVHTVWLYMYVTHSHETRSYYTNLALFLSMKSNHHLVLWLSILGVLHLKNAQSRSSLKCMLHLSYRTCVTGA